MAERLDSVPDSSYNSDEEDDEIDYYYQQDSYEPGEEELNEMAANVDPEYYEYKCLSKYDDIVRYVDERSDKLRSFRKVGSKRTDAKRGSPILVQQWEGHLARAGIANR